MHFTCNWVVLGVFNTSRNKVSRSSVEIIKSVQETSWRSAYSLKLDSCSTPSICRGLWISKFWYDFLGINDYVFGLSFLLILVLRAVKEFISCTSIEQTLFKQIVTADEVLALVHLFLLKKLLCICTIGFCDQASFWSSSCGWTKELCSRKSS